MPSPADLRFTDSHEWFRVDGDVVTVGITQFAANELTDVTYVDLREVGTELAPGDAAGEVESVKTTSDVYSAVGGEIIEVNAAATEDPSVINRDPFGDGWLIRLRTADASPLGDLLDQPTYDEKYPVE